MGLTYSGHSAQKEKVRGIAYGSIKRPRLYGGKHITIASREGGDIQHLLSLDVDSYHIVACDIDPLAHQVAVSMGVVAVPNDIVTVVSQVKNLVGWKGISSINVDLCMSLPKGGAILKQILDLGVPRSVKVFFTFLRNRKSGLGDACREKFLSDLLGYTPELHNYQSFTKDSIGSPMCMAIL